MYHLLQKGLKFQDKNITETKCFINSLTPIINEELFSDQQFPSNWMLIFRKHLISFICSCLFFVLQALSQKNDFTDEQINASQNLADDLFRKWLALVGYDGLTHHIHILGAGHIRYIRQNWRDLKCFQNQLYSQGGMQ